MGFALKGTEGPRAHSEESLLERLVTTEALGLFSGFAEIKKLESVDSGEKFKVATSLGSLAFFYERFRNAIDYKQDITLLRSAIERISKRLLWENPSYALHTKSLSESLIRELIWARYVKNGSLQTASLQKIANIYFKYLKFLSLVSNQSGKTIPKVSWRDFVLGIAAGEVEEIVNPQVAKEDVLTNEVTNWFVKRFDWENDIDNLSKKINIWAAIYRGLYKTEVPAVRFHLLKRFYPDWFAAPVEKIESIKDEFIAVAVKLEEIINSTLQLRLYRFVQKHITPFLILSEAVEEKDFLDALNDKKELAQRIARFCDKRYEEIRGRVARGISRSIIYIFVTKILFAMVIEIPYEIFFLGGVRAIPLTTSLLAPPALMGLVGLAIKRPGEENTKKITEKIFDFVFEKDGKKIGFSLMGRKKGGLTYKIFAASYLVLFVAVFALLSFGLLRLHFSLLSALIFYAFLSLILLFGFRVKHTASEFNVVGEDEGFFSNFISTVSLPFLNLGVWLSQQLSKINILMLILDFLIEAPLKNILGVLEDWNLFMKEKKQDIIEVPNQ